LVAKGGGPGLVIDVGRKRARGFRKIGERYCVHGTYFIPGQRHFIKKNGNGGRLGQKAFSKEPRSGQSAPDAKKAGGKKSNAKRREENEHRFNRKGEESHLSRDSKGTSWPYGGSRLLTGKTLSGGTGAEVLNQNSPDQQKRKRRLAASKANSKGRKHLIKEVE